MDTKNLDTFIQVAELGSFTKAAEKLGCSQSTVSFQIKQLENSLDIKLFERINHTVKITEQGRQVLEYAHSVNRLTQQMEKDLKGSAAEKGHIKIAMANSLCDIMLRENFTSFRKDHSKISLKITTAESTEEMLAALNRNDVDMVYTLDNHVYNRDYVIVCEKKMSAHFVCSSKNPLARRKNINIYDIMAEPFILTEKGMSYRKIMDENLAESSLEINPVLEIGNTDLICSLVSQNMGLSFLPDFVAEKYIREGKIKCISVENFNADIWAQLLYHRGKWISTSMKAVMDYLAGNSVI